MAVKKKSKKAAAKPAKKKTVSAKSARHAPVKKAKAKAKIAAKAKPAAKPAAKRPAPPAVKARVLPIVRPGLQPIRPLVMPSNRKGPKPKPPTAKELALYKDLLLKLRDRIIDEISFLSRDNLNRSQKDSSGDLSSYSFHMADQGTDNFDREFAANLLSSEQDVLYEIEEALRRIEAGTYGICESTGEPIEPERLKVLPFARYCVAAQAEMERGKPRFRPFRRTSIQSLESQT